MSRRRLADAVVPVVHFVVTVDKLGAACSIEVLAEHAGPVEDGLQVLEDLDASWGPGGELDTLGDTAAGTPVPLTWETLLLLGTMTTGTQTRGTGATDALDLDVPHGTATRRGPAPGPTADEMHAVAVGLVAQELQDAGCLAARVSVGSRTRVVNEDEWRAFRRAARPPRRSRTTSPRRAR